MPKKDIVASLLNTRSALLNGIKAMAWWCQKPPTNLALTGKERRNFGLAVSSVALIDEAK